MTNYCNTGDTARVTFPDVSTQDFTDTPISVEVKPVWGFQCQLILAQAYGNTTGFWGQSYIYGEVTEIVNIPGIIRFGRDVLVIARGTNNCGGLREIGIWGNYITGPVQIDYVRLLDGGTLQEIEPTYKLTITGNSGGILFTGNFNSNAYTVECVQGCPPNSLDCGDCCLPCDEIFNSISDIRALLSRIR